MASTCTAMTYYRFYMRAGFQPDNQPIFLASQRKQLDESGNQFELSHSQTPKKWLVVGLSNKANRNMPCYGKNRLHNEVPGKKFQARTLMYILK
jgi:hypothetical protein